MLTNLSNWLDERLGWRTVWETIFKRKVPKVNWFYTLGSATLFLALNQAVTGILLTLYYVPTPDHAYETVQFITYELTAGWFIRGLHHYWATTVGTQIAGTAPWVGDFILRVMRGGQELSEVTLARFFGVHVWVLPALLFTLIGVHMYLIIRLGISAPPKKGNSDE